MDILIHFLYCNILLVLTNMVSCIYHNIIQKSFTALKHPLCLEKEMAIHSSSLAWEIPGTEEPGGPQSMGSQRVRHDLVTEQSFFFLISNEVLKFYYFNWRIIYLHYCGGFCYTSTWNCHRYTCVHRLEPFSHLPLCTIPLGHPGAPAPSILCPASDLDWWLVSHMILYRFQCNSPK